MGVVGQAWGKPGVKVRATIYWPLTAAAGLVSCYPGHGDASFGRQRKDLPITHTARWSKRASLRTSSTQWIQIQAFGQPAHELDFLLYDALGRLRPGQCSLDRSDGCMVHRRKPEQGVICPAGIDTPKYELTSADVVFSLLRAAGPSAISYSSGELHGLRLGEGRR